MKRTAILGNSGSGKSHLAGLEPCCIVEGVYGELIEPFLSYADLLVWIDVPWEVSRQRLESRRRPTDLALDRPAFDKLLTYAAAYWQRDDGRSYAGHRRLFEMFSRRKAHLASEQAVDAFLKAQRAAQ